MFWSSQVIAAVALSAVLATDLATGPLTQHVNIFTGTAQNDDPGNVFAGAATPFGMAKVTVQVAGYAPAGYVSVSTELTRGVSPLHDSGTGSSAGSYGNFCIMPVVCKEFLDCPRLEQPRSQRRVGDGNNDTGFPGYFSTPLANGVRIELASTQAASLERYTFPEGSTPTLVLDWTDDSQHSFLYGEMHADWKSQRLTMNGTYRSSFGPSQFTYTAFQCVDLSVAGTITDHAFFGGNANGMDAVRADLDRWVLPPIAQRLGRPDFEQPTQAGAIVRFKPSSDQKGPIIVRRGVSYSSTEVACKNMKRELPDTDFNKVVAASNAMWEDKLGRIVLSDDTTDPIRKLFYTSFYRTFLSPNNVTGNAPPPYTDSSHPYFDGLYCSWDTYRTLFPLMALTSPREMAQIVDTYIDGYRREGWLLECRANNVKGYVQGSNNGVPVVADFIVKYADQADKLGLKMDDFWKALKRDVDEAPPNWDYEGRRIETYNKIGYIAYDYLDTTSVGQRSREASRGLEYAFGDFAVGMAARALKQPASVSDPYFKRSLSYRNNFNPNLQSDGFSNFVARRFENGTFAPSNPTDCSPRDSNSTRPCSTQATNTFGIYESSSWEYSLYAPHDVKGLVELLGGNKTFEHRLHHFFDAGYYLPGNEPSFQTPSLFHHIGRPAESVQQVRRIVYDNFNLTRGGLPGNDDNAAMASLLTWYLLGFYPVPASGEMLVLSPFMPGYKVQNELMGTVNVKVTGFDPASLARNIPSGARAYVDTVKLDGVAKGRCRIDFKQFFAAKDVEFVMVDAKKDGCDGQEPSSLSTGGFSL
ncbi:putative secreted glycosidase [Colletotrichum aenigma]|uniref:putative secreted glycosidase n=1 Tax=Colletotrichum aenigma TaxID=1215731 RepID=UPI001872C286|nr:putative secreted glycosidase [Colletotrichum aenigma]KAF5512168.1 putative secreted glycosidase [Colletotrichum aenigma]